MGKTRKRRIRGSNFPHLNMCDGIEWLPLPNDQCPHRKRPTKRVQSPVKIVQNLDWPTMAYGRAIHDNNPVPVCRMDPMNVEYIVYNGIHGMRGPIKSHVVINIRQRVVVENQFYVSENCSHHAIVANYPHDSHNIWPIVANFPCIREQHAANTNEIVHEKPLPCAYDVIRMIWNRRKAKKGKKKIIINNQSDQWNGDFIGWLIWFLRTTLSHSICIFFRNLISFIRSIFHFPFKRNDVAYFMTMNEMVPQNNNNNNNNELTINLCEMDQICDTMMDSSMNKFILIRFRFEHQFFGKKNKQNARLRKCRPKFNCFIIKLENLKSYRECMLIDAYSCMCLPCLLIAWQMVFNE